MQDATVVDERAPRDAELAGKRRGFEAAVGGGRPPARRPGAGAPCPPGAPSCFVPAISLFSSFLTLIIREQSTYVPRFLL